MPCANVYVDTSVFIGLHIFAATYGRLSVVVKVFDLAKPDGSSKFATELAHFEQLPGDLFGTAVIPVASKPM